MIVVDAMEGVRAALRWLLGVGGIRDVVEAGSCAEALALPGRVLVAGLRLPDGTAQDLTRAPRPVVVVTWLPPDEREDVDLSRAVAVLRCGSLRRALPAAVQRALLQQG